MSIFRPTGIVPLISWGNFAEIPAGSISITGYAPSVDVPNEQFAEIPAGAITLTGYAPDVDNIAQDQTAEIPAGSMSVTGYAPDTEIFDHQFSRPPAGALTFTGNAPDIDGMPYWQYHVTSNLSFDLLATSSISCEFNVTQAMLFEVTI